MLIGNMFIHLVAKNILTGRDVENIKHMNVNERVETFLDILPKNLMINILNLWKFLKVMIMSTSQNFSSRRTQLIIGRDWSSEI